MYVLDYNYCLRVLKVAYFHDIVLSIALLANIFLQIEKPSYFILFDDVYKSFQPFPGHGVSKEMFSHG